MIIVKKFEIEMAHIVRNAWSNRCAKSVHGHTYTIEVAVERNVVADELHDDGRMVVDFGLIKKYLHPYIDSYDHAVMLWSEDKPEIVDFFKNNFERVIVCPESSSCEMMSAVFFVALERIILTVPELQDVALKSVVVHETRTGRAICDSNSEWLDLVEDKAIVENTWFAPAIIAEWPEHIRTAGVGWDASTNITPEPEDCDCCCDCESAGPPDKYVDVDVDAKELDEALDEVTEALTKLFGEILAPTLNPNRKQLF